jgi:hypothetical protein
LWRNPIRVGLVLRRDTLGCANSGATQGLEDVIPLGLEVAELDGHNTVGIRSGWARD